MIKGTFKFADEVMEVIIDNNNLLFSITSSGVITTIEGLRLSKEGIIKEFPDLKNNPNWKKIAIERFKVHIKKIKTQQKKLNYIRDELTKHGYEPLFYQKGGFRPQKFK